MSESLYVCALDLPTLQRVVGSRDLVGLEKILAQRAEDIRRYDAYFANDNPPAFPLAGVISAIFAGRLADPGIPHWQYESAVATIVDALGTRLGVELLSEAKSAFCAEVDALIVALRRASGLTAAAMPSIGEILERGPLLPIPLDPKLRLGTGYMTSDEVRQADAAVADVALDAVRPSRRERWPSEARDAVDEYRGWLRAAATAERGLFMHR